MSYMNDGFWLCCDGVGCFCVLKRVHVRCGWGKKLVLHCAKFFKELGFNSPKVISFVKNLCSCNFAKEVHDCKN
jgi:hypothetical protein